MPERVETTVDFKLYGFTTLTMKSLILDKVTLDECKQNIRETLQKYPYAPPYQKYEIYRTTRTTKIVIDGPEVIDVFPDRSSPHG